MSTKQLNLGGIKILLIIALVISVVDCKSQNPIYPISSITKLMNNYRGYDMNSDGIVEINQFSYLPFENNNDDPKINSKLILVLVEDRILNSPREGMYTNEDLLQRLSTYKKDLLTEGYATRFIKADIYDGTEHQDGQTLLAIRRFLKDVKRSWNLQGVVLVGSFPEAMIVRRWIWRPDFDITIQGVEYSKNKKNKRSYLCIVPENVAPRADLILADLDGNWENIYIKGPTDIEAIEAIPDPGTPENYPTDNMIFTSSKFNDRTIRFQDYFWIQDESFERIATPANTTLKLKLHTARRNPEINSSDQGRPNPIALPDILVSRINAKNVGVAPDTSFKDMYGRSFLDRSGKPQIIETRTEINPVSFLKKYPFIERKLLIDYFDLNHKFRSYGNPSENHRTATASYGEGLYYEANNLTKYLSKASSTFATPVTYNVASMLDYVKFLKTPATLKAMTAHSNSQLTQYGDSYNVVDLERTIGGKPWRWKKETFEEHYRYVPTLDGIGKSADAHLHRTIYENKILAPSGASLFIHNGCEVNSPENANRVPYNHNDYGNRNGFQNAESILFFLNGVALASRAKIFNDKPEGFTEELGKNANSRFGDGWKAYFTKESNASGLANGIAECKRSYTWSIIGDWTVKVKYDCIDPLPLSYENFPAQVRDITIGPDNSLWAISNVSNPGGWDIHRYNFDQGKWEHKYGAGTRIASANVAQIIASVNNEKKVFTLNLSGISTRGSATKWQHQSGINGTDVAIATSIGLDPNYNSGSQFVDPGVLVAVSDQGYEKNNGYKMYYKTVGTFFSPWVELPGRGIKVAGGKNSLYHLNESGLVYSWDASHSSKWKKLPDFPNSSFKPIDLSCDGTSVYVTGFYGADSKSIVYKLLNQNSNSWLTELTHVSCNQLQLMTIDGTRRRWIYDEALKLYQKPLR